MWEFGRTLKMAAAAVILAGAWMIPAASADDKSIVLGKADPIVVGSLQSMTGGTSTFGQSSDKGIRLAAEERDKKGGVLGRAVEISTADTESSADKTPLAVLKLIEQDHVVAVLGRWPARGRSRRRRRARRPGFRCFRRRAPIPR